MQGRNRPRRVESLLVRVDVLKQRQNIRWARLINGIQSRLAESRGRLVGTVRPHFWQKAIARGLALEPKTFEVPEWSPAERDELLKHYGIAVDWLDQQTLLTLKNPRLLAVTALEVDKIRQTTHSGIGTCMVTIRTHQVVVFIL